MTIKELSLGQEQLNQMLPHGLFKSKTAYPLQIARIYDPPKTLISVHSYTGNKKGIE